MALMYVFLCALSVVAADDGGRMYFPDEVESLRNSCPDCKNQMTIDKALRLSSITDKKQLFEEFFGYPVGDLEDDIQTADTDRMGGDTRGPVLSKLIVSGCTPELRTVKFPVPTNRSILYIPPCGRIEQCGDCCIDERLTCQPTETETLNFKVGVLEWNGGAKHQEIVSLQRHNKCKCVCITKEQDCTSLQEYRKSDCKCVCKDKDAINRCNAGGNTRRWNSTNCSCDCANSDECSWGHSLSQSSCRCEPDKSKTFPNYSVDGRE